MGNWNDYLFFPFRVSVACLHSTSTRTVSSRLLIHPSVDDSQREEEAGGKLVVVYYYLYQLRATEGERGIEASD
jgi:hypothetical protein